MIISRILGGLGNQMFQYAAGRALSLSSRQPLLLDLTDFKDYLLHQGFELDHVFHAPVKEATPTDVRELLGWRAGKLTQKILRYVNSPLLKGPHLAIEPHFNYWPGLMRSNEPRYLKGYWQSEKYFKDFEEILRLDFNFRENLKGDNLDIATSMQNCNSVSLHVRRGDYMTNAATKNTKFMLRALLSQGD